MAAFCLLTEDRLLCPVCRGVFTDPVSTPCGHNFCRDCVVDNVSVDVPFQCPGCLKMFYPRPELQVNALIAEMVDEFKRRVDGGGSTTTVVFCVMFCFLLLFFQNNPSFHSIEEAAGKKLEESIRGVILDLQLKVVEVKHLVDLNLKGDLHQHISIPQMEQMINDVLLRVELMRVRRFAVDVTLDPDAAHPELILSPDRKQVRCCRSKDKPKSFSFSFSFSVLVLGKQSFSSGRFYFEVQVQEKTDWTLGVAKVSRKKDTMLRPQSGYWSISLRNRTEFRGLSDPPVLLPLRPGPEKVGVFVDYEEGLVFFYDAESAAFIFSFTGIFFTERLYPFFDPGHDDDGRNSAPLTINSVSLNKI